MDRRLAALILCLPLAGCAGNRIQTIEIPPTKTLSSSNVGTGHSVAVTVVDSRTNRRIGQVSYFSKDSTAPGPTILTKPEIPELFATASSDALRAHGFAVSEAAPIRLTVEIVEVEMMMTAGVWTSTYYYAAKVKYTATDGGQSSFREFSSSDEWGGVMLPGPKYFTMLSDQISKVTDQAVNDRDILDILVGRKMATQGE